MHTPPAIAATCSNSVFHMKLPNWRQCEIFSLRYLFLERDRKREKERERGGSTMGYVLGPITRRQARVRTGYQENRGNMNPSGVSVVSVRLPWHLNLAMSHQKWEQEHERYMYDYSGLWSLWRVLNVVFLLFFCWFLRPAWPSWNLLEERQEQQPKKIGPSLFLPLWFSVLPSGRAPLHIRCQLISHFTYFFFGLKRHSSTRVGNNNLYHPA